MQTRFADALFYFNATEPFARSSNQPRQQIRVLEQMGAPNYRIRKPAEAVENREKAVESGGK